MKRIVLIAMMMFCLPAMMLFCTPASAQTEKPSKLIGMSGGLGLPMETYDLEAVGMNIHLSFDY